MEAKDNPRVFIGNSLELSAIISVVCLSFFFFFNIVSVAFRYFFRGLTVSYYHRPHFFSDMW